MSNPTTPFSWQMPTATDLVTDLPADFEVFGQAVATSMADLLGGASGYILSKASATDMDFAWIANDQGDITGVTAGTGLTGGGTSGAVTLNIDPTYAGFTNLNYIANPVLNSSFNVWQRGTTGTANSFAAGAGYNADRWQNYYAGTLTVSRQATGDTTNLPFIQYCARVQRNAGQTNTGGLSFGQSIETTNSIPYAGKTVTLSYYARKGANYSATSNALGVAVSGGTGTDQNVFTGFTGGITLLSATSTLTATWQRFTHTFAVAGTYTQLGFVFTETPTGTAGAADYFEMTGVQIDVGSVALPFRANGSTYEVELAACQRYFIRYGGTADTPFIAASYYSTTEAYGSLLFPVQMRTAPTTTVSAGTAINVFSGGSSRNTSGVASSGVGSFLGQELKFTTAVAVVGDGAFSRFNSTSTIDMSAEL